MAKALRPAACGGWAAGKRKGYTKAMVAARGEFGGLQTAALRAAHCTGAMGAA